MARLRRSLIKLNGKFNGSYLLNHNNGNVQSMRNFTDGILSDWLKTYCDRGLPLEEGRFLKGKAFGKWNIYNDKYQRGLLFSGHFKEGVLENFEVWNVFNENELEYTTYNRDKLKRIDVMKKIVKSIIRIVKKILK